MIVHNCAQHGEEWERLRIGIPTSSEFSKIVTTTGASSESWRGYAYRLITERIKKRPLKPFRPTAAMERGQIVEVDAVAWYEFDQDAETQYVGFITDDDHTMGCSPDRLVGDDGLLEIKAPYTESGEQVRYLIERRPHLRHKQQLQGQLMIAERDWVDIVCWDPDLPKCRVRVGRDEHFMLLLRSELRKFNEFLQVEYDKIVTGGFVHVPEAKATLRQQLLATREADQRT